MKHTSLPLVNPPAHPADRMLLPGAVTLVVALSTARRVVAQRSEAVCTHNAWVRLLTNIVLHRSSFEFTDGEFAWAGPMPRQRIPAFTLLIGP